MSSAYPKFSIWFWDLQYSWILCATQINQWNFVQLPPISTSLQFSLLNLMVGSLFPHHISILFLFYSTCGQGVFSRWQCVLEAIWVEFNYGLRGKSFSTEVWKSSLVQFFWPPRALTVTITSLPLSQKSKRLKTTVKTKVSVCTGFVPVFQVIF